MQHIPVVSHVLFKRGDSFAFENDGRGPYYTNDWLITIDRTCVCSIYSREGRAFTGNRGVEREAE